MALPVARARRPPWLWTPKRIFSCVQKPFTTTWVGEPRSTATQYDGGNDTWVLDLNNYVAQVQQPINADGSSVFNAKRGVVPVKFTLNLNGMATSRSWERKTLTGNGGAWRPPRQLLIILDAMEWALVSEWARAGKLPAFHRLLEEGARAELASTAAQLPDTVWAAIYSGTNPAKFAKYFYVQYDAASGDLQMLNDDAIGATPFWDQLSAAGRRVCVLDVPKFPVSREINGFHVTNWGSHATSAKRASQPPGLLDEINKRFGKHPVGDCDATDENPRSWRRLRQHLLAGIELHGEMCRLMMDREDWDVFFAGFSETHCVGHHFW